MLHHLEPTETESAGERMLPPTNVAIPEISPAILYAGQSNPRLLSFFSAHRPAFLFAAMNPQKSKEEKKKTKQRRSFLTKSIEIAQKRMNVKTRAC